MARASRRRVNRPDVRRHRKDDTRRRVTIRLANLIRRSRTNWCSRPTRKRVMMETYAISGKWWRRNELEGDRWGCSPGSATVCLPRRDSIIPNSFSGDKVNDFPIRPPACPWIRIVATLVQVHTLQSGQVEFAWELALGLGLGLLPNLDCLRPICSK